MTDRTDDTDRTNEVLFTVQDGVAWLTFNRPEARNAMTFGMYTRLTEICAQVDQDDSIKVMVLRGAGDKAFVAGTDIGQFRAFKKPEDAIGYEGLMDKVFDALEDVRVPTIAAIQGACTGGGAAIAASCDLRIGAPSAKFGFPIARTLGNTLSTRNYARLAGLLGLARTKDMIFLARLLDASEMKAIGLLGEITTEDGLYARAGELARTLIDHAPITLQTAKQALNAVIRHWTPPASEAHVVRAYMSQDFQEGVEAFLAKRKPRWRGL
ncbi:MAG: enoyl-CoA hydratase/isomerase family protein [Myxococcales bacterium]